METKIEKENEAQKELVLSNEEHHLLDLFAPINRWTKRDGHHALVFLCDGKNSMLFCENYREVGQNLAITVTANPKMAACFKMIAEDVDTLTDIMHDDVDMPEWKEEYDKVEGYEDLPECFFFGAEVSK
jgi:hypothetical protein